RRDADVGRVSSSDDRLFCRDPHRPAARRGRRRAAWKGRGDLSQQLLQEPCDVRLQPVALFPRPVRRLAVTPRYKSPHRTVVMFRRFLDGFRPPARIASHPVFAKFPILNGEREPGFHINFIGQRISLSFYSPYEPEGGSSRATDYPVANEEIFEWIALLEA